MKIGGMRVRLFRCQIDPMLSAKPRLAHIPEDNGWDAVMSADGMSIIVNRHDGRALAAVPLTNVQSYELYPPEGVDTGKKK